MITINLQLGGFNPNLSSIKEWKALQIFIKNKFNFDITTFSLINYIAYDDKEIIVTNDIRYYPNSGQEISLNYWYINIHK